MPEAETARDYRKRLTLPGSEERRAPVAGSDFVVVDLETTGGKPPDHRIIEAAAVRIENLMPTASYSQLVDPGRQIPPFVQELTGISQRMVEGAPHSVEVLPELKEFIGDAVVVAHNSPFDLKFLNHELTAAGYAPIDNPVLCSCRLSRALLPELPSRSLGELIETFDLAVEERHRALSDARATAELTCLLIGELIRQGASELDEVLAAQYRRDSQPLPSKPSLRALRDRILQIREYNSEDLPKIFRWFSDPELWRSWYPGREGPDFNLLRREFQRIAYRDKLFIVEREAVPVGLTALTDLELDAATRRGELRMAVAEPDYRGRGLGVHALSQMLNYSFEFLTLDYLNTRIDPDRADLLRIAERFGFEPNPHSRGTDKTGQKLFRLTREDWESLLSGAGARHPAPPIRRTS